MISKHIAVLLFLALLVEVLHGSSAFVRTPPAPLKAFELNTVRLVALKKLLRQIPAEQNLSGTIDGPLTPEESEDRDEHEPDDGSPSSLTALISNADDPEIPARADKMFMHEQLSRFRDFPKAVHRPPIA